MKISVILMLCLAVAVSAGCGSENSDRASQAGLREPGKTTGSGSGSEVSGGDLQRFPKAAAPATGAAVPGQAQRASQRAYLTSVFEDVQAFWRREFAAAGVPYSPAKLVIFSGQVHTACGTETAASGPFYCPADAGVYLDTRFFDAMARRFQVTGDLARGYVIAHELGHHVQTELQITHRLAAAKERDPAGANGRSVRFELQADCLAGVWAHSSYRRGQITSSDIDDALHAAAVVGSDFQQVVATGTIRPEEWTHGSSADRQRWFKTGFEQGAPGACDTFASP